MLRMAHAVAVRRGSARAVARRCGDGHMACLCVCPLVACMHAGGVSLTHSCGEHLDVPSYFRSCVRCGRERRRTVHQTPDQSGRSQRVALAVGRLLLGRGVRDGPSKLYSNQNKISAVLAYFPEEAHGGAWGGKPRVHARCCIGCPGPYRYMHVAPTKKLHGDHVLYSKGEACQQVTHPLVFRRHRIFNFRRKSHVEKESRRSGRCVLEYNRGTSHHNRSFASAACSPASSLPPPLLCSARWPRQPFATHRP